jgi:hypothetical protein
MAKERYPKVRDAIWVEEHIPRCRNGIIIEVDYESQEVLAAFPETLKVSYSFDDLFGYWSDTPSPGLWMITS